MAAPSSPAEVSIDPSRYSAARRLRLLLRRGADGLAEGASDWGGRSESGRHSRAYSDGGSSDPSSGTASGHGRGRGHGQEREREVVEYETASGRGRSGASGGGGGGGGGGYRRSPEAGGAGRIVDLPSTALGLRWSMDGDGASSSSSGSESESKSSADWGDRGGGGRPAAVADFVPSAPQCRSIDEAMFALHELLTEAGRSPYDAEETAPYRAGEGDYDWLLDGSDDGLGDGGGSSQGSSTGVPSEEVEGLMRRLYGDAADDEEEGKGSFERDVAAALGTATEPFRAVDAEDVAESDIDVSAVYHDDDAWDASFDDERDLEQLGSLRVQPGPEGATQNDDGSEFGAFVSAASVPSYGEASPAKEDERDGRQLTSSASEDPVRSPREVNSSADVSREHPISGDAKLPESAAREHLRLGNVQQVERRSASSSSSCSSASTPLTDEDEPEDLGPPILLDLAIGHSADLLRSLPLAEPSSIEGRFVRRTQLRLQSLTERGDGDRRGIDGRSSTGTDRDDISNDSSLRTEDGEEDEAKEQKKTRKRHTFAFEREDDWWCRSASDIERSLPNKFFSESGDPLLDVLLAVPWDERPPSDPAYVHGIRASFDKMSPYDDHFSRKLSELDQAQRRVTKRLVSRILEKNRALEQGMNRIQEIDLDIARAQLDAKAGANCLRRARGSAKEANDGLMGSFCILRDSELRDRLKAVRKVLEDADEIIRTESSLRMPPTNVDEYADRIESAIWLREATLRLGDGQLSRLESLSPLRERADGMFMHLARQMEASLAKLVGSRCSELSLPNDDAKDQFLMSEYSKLLRARHSLFERQEVLQVNAKDCNREGEITNEDHSRSREVELEIWSESLVGVFCFEADKCLIQALIDPTKSAHSREESKYIADLSSLQEQINLVQYSDVDSHSALRCVLQNLLTVRFDLEQDQNYLPWVYHKLFVLISEVMHVYHIFEHWHETFSEGNNFGHSSGRRADSDVALLAGKLRESRRTLWKHCESVIVQLLDKYIGYTSKKNLQGNDDAGAEGKWSVQLEGLHDIMQLSNQMSFLGYKFIGGHERNLDETCKLINDQWESKLASIFRSHLRGIHVEAMNTMGAMLSHETWHLFPIELKTRSRDEKGDEVKDTLKNLLDRFCPSHYIDPRVLNLAGRRSWENRLHNVDFDFSAFKIHGNPFLSVTDNDLSPSAKSRLSADAQSEGSTKIRESIVSNPISTAESLSSRCKNEGFSRILYQAIEPFIAQDPTGPSSLCIGTQSGMNGLGKWTARLLEVTTKLPLIAEEAAGVISNIFDLYFLTVFRMCAGDERNENVLLGHGHSSSEESADSYSPTNISTDVRGSSIVSNNGAPAISAKPTANAIFELSNADIVAPLSGELEGIVPMRDFVERGRKCLSGMVNLTFVERFGAINSKQVTTAKKEEVKNATETLERQISACTSCLFVAALLDASLARIDTEALQHYSNLAMKATPLLVSWASRIACTRAIKGKKTVLEILMVGRAWKDSQFSELSNDYIDDMGLRCAKLWDGLSCSPHKLPQHALETTWTHIMDGSFLALLEGFSKITICSTEGRALMSMDLATFFASTNPYAIERRLEEDIFRSSRPVLPPSTSTESGMAHVDAYVKAFYFPEQDMQKWINANYTSYQKRHLLGLICCVAASNGWRPSEVDNLTSKVEELYND